ncbi:MAG: sensor domain-containing diguanylate cyclase [Undibacterium sp.]|uniref:GGDEF domain-containing protein n=1 Tax=Undibacterium sp. TaxID=1914977 RepID=UPI00271C51F5|nr:sensor domain-containing diguanylate cyclase [Undibacterium sp.]MDO8654676.1 sensor domain-containing diguanylate cyclase [Undibacterium sp.]
MDTDATQALTEPAANPTNEKLRTENRLLRQQLQDFLTQAHDNQLIMSRHQRLVLELIGAGSFRELIDSIFSTLASNSNLDIVTLSLIDRHHNLRLVLQDLQLDLSEFPQLMLVPNEHALGLPQQGQIKPLLGAYSEKIHAAFFPSCTHQPASVAIVPLIRHQKLIGCLNLGSVDLTRFSTSMATDFVEQMASIIAICLENVINNERLTYLGLTDPLTNISNRRNVEQRMREEIARSRRQQYSIACMYLDIDFFKQVNDQYGHQGGDDVLKEVASRIKAELRLSDTLGRFGGEEFVVLLVNANQHDAAQVAERIRLSIASKPFQLSMTGECNSSISIGIATLPETHNLGDLDSIAAELLWRADGALYNAKQQGRNRVCQAD